SSAEEPAPNPVYGRLSKIRIGRHPARQRHPRIRLFRRRQDGAIKEGWFNFFLGAWMNHLAHVAAATITIRVIQHNGLRAYIYNPINRQPLEDCRHTPELILRPILKRMVVALSTIQAPSQEDTDFLSHRILGQRRLQNRKIVS